ncbi:MAG: glycerophosphodiester phosphodiesterase family protein [Pseudomonadota bacterium]
MTRLIERPIAHRGLHDGNVTVYENTRSAFQAAIDKGYGIELDVQLSADHHAIVFHDDKLDRLTSQTGTVYAKTTSQIGQMNVGAGTDVPETLDAILTFINGRAPVVVEMKNNGIHNEALASAVTKCVNAYSGAIAVMSFSKDLLRLVRDMDIACPVGLTAEGSGTKAHDAHREAFDIGMDFVSYHVHALPNGFVREARARRVPVITWTVRNAADAALTYEYADQITFEGFRP